MTAIAEEAVETVEFDHGVKAKIFHDNDPALHPRHDEDHVGRMLCWHPKYKLGDEHEYEHPNQWIAEQIRKLTPEQVLPLVRERVSGKTFVGNLVFRYREDYYRRMGGLTKEERRQEWPEWIADHFFETHQAGMMERGIELLRDLGYVILPLSVYDHSGVTMWIGSNPGGWDTSMVGFIVSDPEHLKKMGAEDLGQERLREIFKVEVNEFDCFLRGEVFGVIIETPDNDHAESCWCMIGLDLAREEAREMADPFVREYGDPARYLGEGI